MQAVMLAGGLGTRLWPLREELSDLRELTFSLEPEGRKIVYIGGHRV